MEALQQHNQLLRQKIAEMQQGQEAGLASIFGDDWDKIGSPGQRKTFGRQFKAAVFNNIYSEIEWVGIRNSGRYDVYRKR